MCGALYSLFWNGISCLPHTFLCLLHTYLHFSGMEFVLPRPGNPTECTTVVLKSANGASDRVSSQWGKLRSSILGRLQAANIVTRQQWQLIFGSVQVLHILTSESQLAITYSTPFHQGFLCMTASQCK